MSSPQMQWPSMRLRFARATEERGANRPFVQRLRPSHLDRQLWLDPRASRVSRYAPKTGCCRTIVEAGVNVALGIVFESNTLLTVLNNVVEPFAENAPQCDATYWQLAIGVHGITVLQVNDEQTIQTVIEKRDAFARLRAVPD
jgi:hypothetical protein